MNSCVEVTIKMHGFISLREIPRRRMVGSCGRCVVNFKDTTKHFLWLNHLTSHQPRKGILSHAQAGMLLPL